MEAGDPRCPDRDVTKMTTAMARDTCPSGVFEASDASFYINCGNNRIFQHLMAQVLERPELAAAPEYATGKDRIARSAELFAILGDAFRQQPRTVWQARMRAASTPSGPMRSVGEAVRSAEARERRLVSRLPHPEHG